MIDHDGTNELRAQFGAFARIFREGSADALADRFAELDLRTMQFNFSALGYPALPGRELVENLDLAGIAGIFAARSIRLWGVSSTYNMAHPDATTRNEATRHAAEYVAALGPMEAEAVTLCTGTRDPENMWRWHPDNVTEAAWNDFRRSIDALLPAAAEAGLKLAIEPEPGNVLTGTAQAKRLVRELGDDAGRIGFILDPANLVGDAPWDRHQAILGEAFAELGGKALCLHGKDPHGWQSVLDGQPGLDWSMLFDLYRQLPESLPFIVQDATPEQLPQVRSAMVDAFQRASSS